MPSRLAADQRREQLLEVSIDLFSRKGFNGATTREIARAAGVTEAIIFRHFATKEELYKAIIDRKVKSPLFEQWIAELRSCMKQNDDEAVVRRLIHAIITTHRLDPKFERVMLYAALEGNLFAIRHMRQVTADVVGEFRAYFARRVREGSFARIHPEIALNAIIGTAFHYAQNTYIHGCKEETFSDEEAMQGFVQIALNGIRKTSSLPTKKRKK